MHAKLSLKIQQQQHETEVCANKDGGADFGCKNVLWRIIPPSKAILPADAHYPVFCFLESARNILCSFFLPVNSIISVGVADA